MLWIRFVIVPYLVVLGIIMHVHHTQIIFFSSSRRACSKNLVPKSAQLFAPGTFPNRTRDACTSCCTCIYLMSTCLSFPSPRREAIAIPADESDFMRTRTVTPRPSSVRIAYASKPSAAPEAMAYSSASPELWAITDWVRL
jgi:hypothetical protein